MATKILPSQSYLRECFLYDPRTGVLTWKKRPAEHFADERGRKMFNKRYAGTEAGHADLWAVNVSINGAIYKAHRLIYRLVTGQEPPEQIDHANGDVTDNAWTNLRLASPVENARNRTVRSDNKTGFRGVWFGHGRYYVRIMANGRRFRLGGYATAQEAHAAYCEAAKRLHGQFMNRG